MKQFDPASVKAILDELLTCKPIERDSVAHNRLAPMLGRLGFPNGGYRLQHLARRQHGIWPECIRNDVRYDWNVDDGWPLRPANSFVEQDLIGLMPPCRRPDFNLSREDKDLACFESEAEAWVALCVALSKL